MFFIFLLLSLHYLRAALHFLRATVVARFFGALFLNSLRAALHFLRDVVLARFLGLLSLNTLRAAILARFSGLRSLNSLRAAVLASVLFIFFCFAGNCTSWSPANTHEYEEVGEHNEAETVQAQKKSKNRAKEVLEVNPITSVTKQVTKDMLIKHVIPCIQEKWPAQLSKDVHIQQDNARPHIQGLDSDFMAAGNTNGFHITLNNQPPNSPDLNVLDLGFFRAIQSLKEQCAPISVPELLEAVQRAYNALNPETLNKVWLTYQQVLTKVMEHEGSNNYRLPHMGKDRLAREGNLPKSLSIDLDLIQKTARFVGQQNGGRNEGMVEFNTEEGDDYLSSDLN
ncbi:unnamed protein product [Cuscuta campestris]|uniref:Uncharacterized protein n=1 Tax=Cuscuta campestris TaxID=132261 RepID=A0A484L4N9_9ASTE|nr:unnamed protein product [Cuscuta campestris]